MKPRNFYLSLLLFAFDRPAFAQDSPLPRSTSVTVRGVKVELKNCQKASTKSITCHFTITNLQADRQLVLQGNSHSHFVDSSGMEIEATQAQLGSRSSHQPRTEVVTDVPVRASMDFGVGDPKATSLAKLSIGLWADDDFRVEFRKVPLEGN